MKLTVLRAAGQDGVREEVTLSYPNLVPDAWGFRDGSCDILTECYRVHYANEGDIICQEIPGVELVGCRLLFVYGTLDYLGVDLSDFQSDTLSGERATARGPVVRRTTPKGGYALFLAPQPIEASREQLAETARRIEQGVTLTQMLLSKNAAFQQVFSQVLESRGNVSTSVRVDDRPGSYPNPTLTMDAFRDLATAAQKIDRLEASAQHRVHLALRWASEGMTGVGIDTFLRNWIALETLAMPTNNPDELSKTLGEIYELNVPEVASKFQVGRLFRLRGRVVHEGALPDVTQVARYMQALVTDVIRHVIGMPPQRRAEKVLDQQGLDLPGLLAQLISQPEL